MPHGQPLPGWDTTSPILSRMPAAQSLPAGRELRDEPLCSRALRDSRWEHSAWELCSFVWPRTPSLTGAGERSAECPCRRAAGACSALEGGGGAQPPPGAERPPAGQGRLPSTNWASVSSAARVTAHRCIVRVQWDCGWTCSLQTPSWRRRWPAKDLTGGTELLPVLDSELH